MIGVIIKRIVYSLLSLIFSLATIFVLFRLFNALFASDFFSPYCNFTLRLPFEWVRFVTGNDCERYVYVLTILSRISFWFAIGTLAYFYFLCLTTRSLRRDWLFLASLSTLYAIWSGFCLMFAGPTLIIRYSSSTDERWVWPRDKMAPQEKVSRPSEVERPKTEGVRLYPREASAAAIR